MLNSHAVRAIKNRRAIITQDGDYTGNSVGQVRSKIDTFRSQQNTHDAKNLADLPDVKYKGYLISLNAYGEYFVSRNNHGNWQPIPNAKFGNENNAKSYIDTLPKVTTDRKPNLHPRWRKSGDKAAIRKIKDCLMGIKKTRDASSEEQIKKDFSEKKISSMEAAKKLTEIGYSKSDALITVSLWSKGKYYQGKVTDQIIKGFMIYKSGKNPNTYYAKNENGEEYDGTMEEIKKKIDAYWMKRDEDVMKQKTKGKTKDIAPGDIIEIRSEYGGLKGKVGIVGSDYLTGKYLNSSKLFTVKKQPDSMGQYVSYTFKDSIPNPRFKIKDDKIFRLRSAVKKMKDALVSVRQNMSTKKVEYKVGGQWKPIEGKVKTAYENEQIKYDYADGGYHYFTCEVKDSKTKDSTGAFSKGELETTDDLFYKGVYYKPQELYALLVKEGMTKKLNELTESEKRDRKGNAWPLYESNGGVFAVVN